MILRGSNIVLFVIEVKEYIPHYKRIIRVIGAEKWPDLGENRQKKVIPGG
jgi:hypothetical protein